MTKTDVINSALHHLKESMDLAEHRAFRMHDWLAHHADSLDPKRVREHLDEVRDAIREAQSWTRAVTAAVPPFEPTPRR